MLAARAEAPQAPAPKLEPLDLKDAIALYGRDAMRVHARHVLVRRGQLSFLRRPYQEAAVAQFHAAKAKRSVWCWARRVGKSWALLTLAFEVALRIPGARIPYAASTRESLLEFIIPIAISIAAEMPEELRPVVVGFRIRFPNGSRIVLQGCEDRKKADRLRGPSADLAIIDEAGFIPVLDYVVRSVLLSQLLTTGGRMLIASTPPETEAHPFTAFAHEAEERDAYSHHDVYDAQPYVTEQQIEEYCVEAGGPESVAWKREGLALFVTDPTRAILPEFEKVEKEIVIEVPRPTHFDAYVVGDLGFTDLSVILFGYWHFAAAAIVVEDELALERATSDVVQQESAKMEARLWGSPCPAHDGPLCTRCVQSTGWVEGQRPRARLVDTTVRTAADMTALQNANDPTSDSRWGTVVNADRAAAVNALRVDLQFRRVLIHPRCKVLIAHCRHGVWNERKTDFARVKQVDTAGTGGIRYAHFDGVAALMYLGRHVDRNRNPNPAPTYDEATQHVPREIKEAQARKGWGGLVRRKGQR